MALLEALEMVWKTLRQAQHPSTLIKPTHGMVWWQGRGCWHHVTSHDMVWIQVQDIFGRRHVFTGWVGFHLQVARV